MKTTIKVIAVSTVLSLSSLAQASTDSAIEAAENARQAAAAVGYEWRDTAKMIKQAQKLAAEGKTSEAEKIARKAEEQSKDAVAQYHAESQRYTATH